ncbi:MAG: hypothetical protein FRX49_00439 [Trebouxia sp. A1-2]|nr:MAG: hypothetical protein FRX49_00439 [Trebouxia sp. A1-2]
MADSPIRGGKAGTILVFVKPWGAIKLSWQAAALHVAKRAEEGHDLFARGLKGHVAHDQLGALLLWLQTARSHLLASWGSLNSTRASVLVGGRTKRAKGPDAPNSSVRLGSATFDSRLGKSDVIIGPDGARPTRLHQLQELCQLRIICRTQHHPFRMLQQNGMGHHIALCQEDKLISLKHKGDWLWAHHSVGNNISRGPHETAEETTLRQQCSYMTNDIKTGHLLHNEHSDRYPAGVNEGSVEILESICGLFS